MSIIKICRFRRASFVPGEDSVGTQAVIATKASPATSVNTRMIVTRTRIVITEVDAFHRALLRIDAAVIVHMDSMVCSVNKVKVYYYLFEFKFVPFFHFRIIFDRIEFGCGRGLVFFLLVE